jgi:hypothetical protein
MSESDSAKVVRLEGAQVALRNHFLGWQCRLRQLAVREAEGRPSEGMRPILEIPGAESPPVQITTLIVHLDPQVITAEFRHLVRRTQDPAERHKSALRLLSASYYQYPEDFSDRLTALFGPSTDLAAQLPLAGRCTLHFEQYSQRYRLPCGVRSLPEDDPAYQATFWHNSMFNPYLPAGVKILAFAPDWAEAEADPPVP